MTDSKPIVELKPCPFCGGKAYLANMDMVGCSYVVCTDCRTQSDDMYKARAITAWNTRDEPAQPNPLGAAWMREQAAGLRNNIADQIGARPMSSIHSGLCEYAIAIRAIPDPTSADLLAMPEVRSVIRTATMVTTWDGCWPGNINLERCVDDLKTALTALVQP